MMKNITLSADNNLIQQARRLANSENESLNELFQEWLARYVAQPHVAQPGASEQYMALMQHLSHVEAGESFSRDEMNERR